MGIPAFRMPSGPPNFYFDLIMAGMVNVPGSTSRVAVYTVGGSQVYTKTWNRRMCRPISQDFYANHGSLGARNFGDFYGTSAAAPESSHLGVVGGTLLLLAILFLQPEGKGLRFHFLRQRR